ncbi:uncharacterized protein LAESUDRAFT_730632 [Laetiporus sulphureus 93-53]|uniref:SigF-like NTF2-like domain-containing protein n=1 Tax=Laetiporus sulphureus 93-53 TaxID=1314785 RepID=A0A165BZK1_9APHY|nr:uncharacterized protein LAESUDRAFT_730632 [Laetiporus sulphureus 93-53]KZT01936.1 hypothetical protein LAESUDRAFT_730632 [Laetiporus sulphureus 93-53]
MEDPARDIEDVILSITSAVNPEAQKAAILRYFAPDASFRHPLCTVPSDADTPYPASQSSPSFARWTQLSRKLSPTGIATASSRETILCVYQWYRTMSPRLKVEVRKVVWDEPRMEIYVDVVQTFHIRWNPLPPAQSRLITHLNLRKVSPRSQDARPLYVIVAQEDFYHPADLLAFVLPPLVPILHFLLILGTWACVFGAWFGAVSGFWTIKRGEGDREVKLEHAGESLPTPAPGEQQTLTNGRKNRREGSGSSSSSSSGE